MVFLYAAVLTLVNALWLGLNLLGLPGNWLILATAAGAWWLIGGPGELGDLGAGEAGEPGARMFHYGVLIALLVLALLGELLEFLMGAAGAAKSGGSKRGAAGAILGAILGGIIGTIAIPIPIIGSILGACGGAFIGAMVGELHGGKQVGHAVQIGRGAAVGRFWGTVAKLTVGVAMWLTATVAAFWP